MWAATLKRQGHLNNNYQLKCTVKYLIDSEIIKGPVRRNHNTYLLKSEALHVYFTHISSHANVTKYVIL